MLTSTFMSQYQAYSVSKTSGTLVVPFNVPFATPPIVFLTPYYQGQNREVGSVEAVVSVSTTSVTISSGNQGDHYFVNVLAVDAKAQSLDGLPISVGSVAKTAGAVSVLVSPPKPSANLVTAYYPGQSGVGYVETVTSEDFSENGGTGITINSGNSAGEGYFVNYLSAAPSAIGPVEAGIVNKNGGLQRVYFSKPFQTPPIVLLSPWYDNGGGVGQVDTISNVTTSYFDLASGNQGTNFFVSWVAVPAGRGVARQRIRAEHFQAAMDEIVQMVPEEAAQIAQYASLLRAHVVEDEEPPASVLDIAYAVPPDPVGTRSPADLSKCTTAVIRCGIDVTLLAFSIAGLRTANTRRLIDSAIRAVDGTPLQGIRHLIFQYDAALGAWEKAKVAFKIFGGFYNAGGCRAVLRRLRDEMSWWDWIVTALIMAAQLIAFVLSDGIVFVAEVALIILGFANLAEDIYFAVTECQQVPTAPEPGPEFWTLPNKWEHLRMAEAN
jgi:hypothetical protein